MIKLASHRRSVLTLLVTLCWVSCDGLASHVGGSSNTPSHLKLGILGDGLTSHPGGCSNAPSHFMLSIL